MENSSNPYKEDRRCYEICSELMSTRGQLRSKIAAIP